MEPTEELLATHFETWTPHTHTDPAVPGLLTALRERGIKIGVLSNTIWTREWHERVFARDDVLGMIDGAVYSSEIPWTKPHAEAFRAAMDAVGATDPASCVFVGDRPYDDIHGAKSAACGRSRSSTRRPPPSTVPGSRRRTPASTTWPNCSRTCRGGTHPDAGLAATMRSRVMAWSTRCRKPR